MTEYLSKEEIKLWRSSLEKITLEEYAAKLGKKVASSKQTNDIIDIVFKGKAVVSSESGYKSSQAERISSIAERAFEREQQIAPTPFSIHKLQLDEKAEKTEALKNEKKTVKKTEVKQEQKPVKKVKVTAKKTQKVDIKPAVKKVSDEDLREEVRIVFKKALTDREQKVFDYFVQNKGNIVYARDLANLLELPKDYVYKYIKNLRAKIDGEKLENADKGGFVLHV